jgi:hypothetical protein
MKIDKVTQSNIDAMKADEAAKAQAASQAAADSANQEKFAVDMARKKQYWLILRNIAAENSGAGVRE